MQNIIITSATAISSAQPLALSELAHACGADAAWVLRLIEVGIVHATTASQVPEHGHFSSGDLRRALEARRLERDFGVDLDAAALILDLRHEVRRLKNLLEAHGFSAT